MARQISIGYRESAARPSIDIEVSAPYFLFGTLRSSERFWSLSLWKEIGVERLADLGELDPIYFIGWEMMADLDREIRLVRDHLAKVDFFPEPKARWLAHLAYCHMLLVCTAPPSSIPQLVIG